MKVSVSMPNDAMSVCWEKGVDAVCTPRGNVARGAGERGCCGVMGDIVGVCLRYVVALFSGEVAVP